MCLSVLVTMVAETREIKKRKTTDQKGGGPEVKQRKKKTGKEGGKKIEGGSWGGIRGGDKGPAG